MKCFVPITDEYLYEKPEQIGDELLPFQVEYPCYRWYVDEVLNVPVVQHEQQESG